jgi:hypothetical protein
MSKKTVKDLDLIYYYELDGLKDKFKTELKVGIDNIIEKANILNLVRSNLDDCKVDDLIKLLQDINFDVFDLLQTIDFREK